MCLKGLKKEGLENRWEKAREGLDFLKVCRIEAEKLINESNSGKNARKNRLFEGTWKMQKFHISQQRNKIISDLSMLCLLWGNKSCG